VVGSSVAPYVVLGMLCVASSLSAFLFLLHAATDGGHQSDFLRNLSRRTSLIIGLASLAAATAFFLPCYLKWKEVASPVGINEVQDDLKRTRENLLRQHLERKRTIEKTYPAERLEEKKAAEEKTADQKPEEEAE
jgi:hypothetical protein